MQKKSILVHDNYLLLPIGRYVSPRKLLIRCEGKLEDDISLRLDYINPTGYAMYDLRKYSGKTLELEVQPGMEVEDLQVSEPLPPDPRDLHYRPYIHFTANRGWINDPNGLLEYTSPVTGIRTYHMFYQYNPYDTVWGNMHWGHAVSGDLMRWEERPPALEPDDCGTMFSGSAVIDRENRTGLKEGGEDVILLYYTCAGNTSERSFGREFTQCLAYSTDGGETFRKYEGNPVVPHIAGRNRDPKVIWCAEMERYVMALYLEKSEFAVLASDDLIHWSLLQKLVIEGEAECPDIYPLNLDGNPGKRKWIISGASHIYLVCEYRNGRFEAVQSSRRLHYGRNHYAGQTFSDVSDGRRICMAWNREMQFPCAPFQGQMSLPLELTLRSRGSEYDLCARPAAELDTIAEQTGEFRDLALSPDAPWEIPLVPSAYRIRMQFRHSDPDLSLFMFGQTVNVENSKNQIRVKDATLPLSMDGSDRSLTLIVDSCSLDVFTGNGQTIMTVPFLCDRNLNTFRITPECPGRLPLAEISRLG